MQICTANIPVMKWKVLQGKELLKHRIGEKMDLHRECTVFFVHYNCSSLPTIATMQP